MDLTAIKKKHRRNYDAMDQVYWGCTCGKDLCTIRTILNMLDDDEKRLEKIQEDFLSASSIYQRGTREVTAHIAGLKDRLQTLTEG